VVTGSRAEYGSLYWLLKEIGDDDDLVLQLVVAAMHLAPAFGLTWRDIERDGFAIDDKVEMLVSSDSGTGTAKSIGLGIIGFAESFARLRPDLVVVFGDRFEMLAAATAALAARIPVAHIAGGHVTAGAMDDAFRHAITKMAHLHFTSTDAYRRRIIQLGEHPDSVFAVGSTGLDTILREPLLDRKELERAIDFMFGDRNLLITFHPATLDTPSPEEQMGNLLVALDRLEDTHLVFTMPNADPGGSALRAMVEEYVAARPDNTTHYASLGKTLYLSALKIVDGVVGNSSSGIIEAPSLHTGTINVGDRQKGRIRADSVIDCGATTEAISTAIETLYSKKFQESLKTVTTPFGDGHACHRIKERLKSVSLDGIVKKTFYDLDFSDERSRPS
jgi:GDP/UDP-N,N'-diacetylbacillosamine 2-epimerase (hydrolysing)